MHPLQANTPNTSSSSRLQDDLKELVATEIGAQTWEFSAEEIARMLSLKCLKDPNPTHLPSLDDFRFFIEEPDVTVELGKLPIPDVPAMVPEEAENYEIIAQFLNKCVFHCERAYTSLQLKSIPTSFPPLKPVGQHWWPRLTFFKYESLDGINGAAPLPDIADDEPSCVSNMRISGEVLSITPSALIDVNIAVEVKKVWPDLVKQAGTYGRAQTSAVPLRLFSLVIGVNHAKKQLRFLLFHRGGLSTSCPLDLQSPKDRRDIQNILFAIYTWQGPEDAGWPAFTDGFKFKLPVPKAIDQETSLQVKQVYHHALSGRGRNTWVASLHTMRTSTPSLVPNCRTTRLKSATLQTKSKHYKTLGPSSMPDSQPSLFRQKATQAKKNTKTMKVQTSKATEKLEENSWNNGHDRGIQPQTYHNQNADFVPPSHFICPEAPGEMPESVVAKFIWPNEAKRQLEATIYNRCHGDFGSPFHILSFEARTKGGWAFSNAYLLPRSGDEEKSFTRLLGGDWELERPDRRSLWITVFEDEGETLEHCTSAWDLCQCLVHALLGWLSIYQRGYLHRDISIGNVLKLKKAVRRNSASTRLVQKLLDPPETAGAALSEATEMSTVTDSTTLTSCNQALASEASEASSRAVETLSEDMTQLNIKDKLSDPFWEHLLDSYIKDDQSRPIVEYAKKLEEVVRALGITTECVAVLSDCDMAAEIENYLLEEHEGSVSGTAEFMSTNLRDAISNSIAYVQSPVDDMHSFLWTAIWATLFNIQYFGKSPKEAAWRNYLQGDMHARDSVPSQMLAGRVQRNRDYSPLLRSMIPVLRGWRRKLEEMSEDWDLLWEQCDDPSSKRLLFHRFAYRGVLEFLEVIRNEREALQSDLRSVQ